MSFLLLFGPGEHRNKEGPIYEGTRTYYYNIPGNHHTHNRTDRAAGNCCIKTTNISSSHLGFIAFSFTFYCLILINASFSYHSFSIISIFIEGACLVGFFCVFCYLFASHSLSYIYILYQLHVLEILFLSFLKEEDQ